MKNLSLWNQVEVFTLRFVEGVEDEEWRGTKSLWKLFGRCSSIEDFSKSEIKIWLLFKCWAGRKLGWLFAIGSFRFRFSLLTLACLSALLWAVFFVRAGLTYFAQAGVHVLDWRVEAQFEPVDLIRIVRFCTYYNEENV